MEKDKLYICSSVDECDLEHCQAQEPHNCSLGHIWHCDAVKKDVQCVPWKEHSDIEIAFDELLEELC